MKLKEYIEKEFEGNAAAFAKSIGVTRQCVNYWLNGIRDPSYRIIRKIEEITKKKVSYKDWE